MGRRKRKARAAAKERPGSRWPAFLVPGVIGLVLAAGLASWYFLPKKNPSGDAAQYRGGPRLAVDSELIDFGAVRFERVVRATFRLRNVGDQALRLPANPPVEVVEGC